MQWRHVYNCRNNSGAVNMIIDSSFYDEELSFPMVAQPAITFSKLTIETLKQGVKFVLS